MKQTTFASAAWEKKGKVARRGRFLGEMDLVAPWSPIVALIEPHYPKAGSGTQSVLLERMLRIYFMQQWFNLSVEDALYDSGSMRRFAGSSWRTVRSRAGRRSCAFGTCWSDTG